jgi:sodium/proline symporter
LNVTLYVFIIYLCTLIGIAYYFHQKTKSQSEFLLAGRSISAPMTALGAGSSDMSSWLMMVLPAMVYLFGLSQVWLPISLVIGAYLNWTFIAPRLRIYTEMASDSMTLPSYLQNRFKTSKDQSQMLRWLSAVAMLIFFTMYTVAGLIAGAEVIRLVFDLSVTSSYFLISVVVVLYTSLGGFGALNYVDFFQGSLMLMALLAVPISVYLSDDRWLHLTYQLQHDHAQHLEMFTGISWIGLLSLLGWGLGYFGQPHIQVRFMAIKSADQVAQAKRIGMTWMILALLGAIATGLCGVSFYPNAALDVPETIFIVLSQQLFPPVIAGLLIAAVFSAIIGTVSAQLLISASIFVEDVYPNIKSAVMPKSLQKQPKNSLWLVRFSVAVLALVAWFIAVQSGQTLISSVAMAWSGLGACFGPVVLVSLYWKSMSRLGAVAGIVSGMGCVLLWHVFQMVIGLEKSASVGWLPGFEIIPAFMVSLLSIVWFSLKYPMLSAEIKSRHVAVESALKTTISKQEKLSIFPVKTKI